MPRQNYGPYATRTTLGLCVVGLIKAEFYDTVSCDWIAVMKADSEKIVVRHFSIEKVGEDIAGKEMIKKMYMTDFNEPSLKDVDPVTRKYKEITYEDARFLKIMQKEISKVGKDH